MNTLFAFPSFSSASPSSPRLARRSARPGLGRKASMLGALGALFLSLGAGCGGSSSPTGTSTSSTSSTTSTTTGGGGGGGNGGSGGMGGTAEVAPTMTLTKINEPTWEFVDFHQGTFVLGAAWENIPTMLGELLPPPNHEFITDLGIGPGAPHMNYSSEVSESYALHQWKSTAVFSTTEALLPNGIVGAWMVVPSAGAPLGKSPDGDKTPIIPNTLFPMTFAAEDFVDGDKVIGSDGGFDIPPMDEKIDPAFLGVEGHSHYPLFSFRALNDEPKIAGAHERRGSVVDKSGAGWKFTIGFKATE